MVIVVGAKKIRTRREKEEEGKRRTRTQTAHGSSSASQGGEAPQQRTASLTLFPTHVSLQAAQAKKQADSGISPPEIPGSVRCRSEQRLTRYVRNPICDDIAGIRRLPPAPAPMASSIASALAGPTNALTPANREACRGLCNSLPVSERYPDTPAD